MSSFQQECKQIRLERREQSDQHAQPVHLVVPHRDNQYSYRAGDLEELAGKKRQYRGPPRRKRHAQHKQEIGQDVGEAADQSRYRAPRAYQTRVRTALQGLDCKPASAQRYVLNIRFEDGFAPMTTQLATAPAR